MLLGEGRPGNVEGSRRTSSGKRRVSNPRFRQTRYSASTSVAISTAVAEAANCRLGIFDLNARSAAPTSTNRSAVSGTIGGTNGHAAMSGPGPKT